MTDDPHDSLPEINTRWLWDRMMLDRTTDPHARRAIKAVMNTHYGKSVYPAALAVAYAGDPCDEWPFFIEWKIWADDRRAAHINNDQAAFNRMFNTTEPPRNLGFFNCRGEYVFPKGDQ